MLQINITEKEPINHQKKMIEKTLRKNNLTIALNVCMLKKKKIYPSYASKHNSGRGKQVILLMATN